MGLLKSLKGLLAPEPEAARAPAPTVPPAAAADVAEAARRAGNAALQAGRLDEALAHYQRFVAARPDESAAHLNLGFALLESKRPAEAAVALRRACRLDPASHEAPFFLARALAAADEWKEAERALEEAVALRPEFEEGWIELGQLRERRALRGPARLAFERAAEINPVRIDAWQGLARIALLDCDGGAAIAAVDRWLALEPEATIALGMRAEALGHLGRGDEALATAEAALARDSADPLLRTLYITLLLKAGGAPAEAMLRGSEATYRRQLDADPDHVEALAGLGAALLELKRPTEAVAPLERAAALDPEDVSIAHNHALALTESLRFDEAIVALKASHHRHPSDVTLALDLAIAELTAGDAAEGWRLYEKRALPHPRAAALATLPRWQPGQPVAGRRVLLVSEQGLGDAVNFVRYVPRVMELGARVTLMLMPRVRPLVDGVWPGCNVISDDEPLPPQDLYCPLLSLPHVLGITQPLTMAAPYIRSAPDRRAVWRARVGAAAGKAVPIVGLAWSGDPLHKRDRRRSIPLELLRAAAPRHGVRLVRLQYEVRESDLGALAAWPELIDFSAERRADLADTAALIEALDAVVCVDTSVAHVAGALGRPLILLLPYGPDWRWGLRGDRTPWYPTAQLLRQDADGRWEPVLQRTMELLLQLPPREPAS